MNNIETTIALLCGTVDETMELLRAALDLVDEYSGGESESADQIRDAAEELFKKYCDGF
jgi:hypothetical protein